jgi:hypothetical protein
VLTGTFAAAAACAGVSPLSSKLGDSYYFVDHYDIVIDRPANEIWPHLLDFGSWLAPATGKGMIHVSGPRHGEGEVFRLYNGENFFMQVTKIIPDKLLVGVNLPTAQQGESALAGIVMVTLTGQGAKTVVSMFMSRQYSWFGKAPDPLRKVRGSERFAESRRAGFEKSLQRLKTACED